MTFDLFKENIGNRCKFCECRIPMSLICCVDCEKGTDGKPRARIQNMVVDGKRIPLAIEQVLI